MRPAKTVAALHDLSSVGRCALTVVIPVISAMGVQVIPGPTAALSAHTAFPNFVSLDLTDYLEKCLGKWQEMGLQFDAIYSGYLASVRQEEIVRRFTDGQPDALRVVDPVLGDDGVMYRALPPDMPKYMARLCREADVITPNLTEARLLTGAEPHRADAGDLPGTRTQEEVLSLAELTRLLEQLLALKPRTALITGVNLEGTHVNAWMGQDGAVRTCAYWPVPASYPGTGDLFAAVLTGALTRGQPFADSVALATEYVRETMLATLKCSTESVYGVQLEQTLGMLINPEEGALS